MNVTLFYNSSQVQSGAAAAVVLNAFPAAIVFDTKGLDTTAIGVQIATLSAGTQHRIYALVDVGANPPSGNLTGAQVTTLDTKLIGSITDPSSDNNVRQIASASGGKNRSLLAWEDVYPTVNPANLIHILGGFQIYTIPFSGTATSGAAGSLTDSGANFGTSATTGTATSATVTTLTNSAASFTVNAYAGQYLAITGGTGEGQMLPILSNTAKVFTVDGAWVTIPDGT